MNADKTTKRCNVCQEYKPLCKMVKNCQMKDGILSLCLDCKSKKRKNSKAERGFKVTEYSGGWLGSDAIYL